MGICDVCGNEYDKTFKVTAAGMEYTFDSYECAIHMLAPVCDHCQVKIVGHGVESPGKMFCCAACAEKSGVNELQDRVTA